MPTGIFTKRVSMVTWRIKNKRNKMRAIKVEAYGLKFDSKLEKYAFDQFKAFGLEFEFQKKYILQEKFRDKLTDKMIRAITLTVDFVFDINGIPYYVDTKGFATDLSKVKYKMLAKLFEDEDNVIIFVKKAAVKNYAIYLRSKIKGNVK